MLSRKNPAKRNESFAPPERIKLVFFGTPQFSVEILKVLLEKHFFIQGVVTQPDRPAGRKRHMKPSPVKTFALAHGLCLYQPEDLKDKEFLRALEKAGADFFVVVSYGKILPASIIDIPEYMTLNVHPSLLPRYRGAAPIPRAILNGDAQTGVTIIKLTGKLDAGPMLARLTIDILDDDTTGRLEEKLARLGSELVVRALLDCREGKVEPVAQDESQATFAPKIRKEEACIDWSKSSVEIDRLVRAMNPRPGAYSFLIETDRRIRFIIRAGTAKKEGHPGRARSGTIARVSPDGIEVSCGQGLYIIKEVQPAGKKTMPVSDYVRGHRLSPADRFVHP